MSIGRANFNNRIYIVDKQLNLLPPGLPGEICVAGVGLALGYMNLPERTTSVFMADPHAEFFEAKLAANCDAHQRFHLFGDRRLYRTGDVGSWGDDMRVFCHGRIDTQVKIRGYRIEVAEIEQQLLSLPEARAAGVAVVIVRPLDIPGIGTSLVAYMKLELQTSPASPRSPRMEGSKNNTRVETAARFGSTIRVRDGEKSTAAAAAATSQVGTRGRARSNSLLRRNAAANAAVPTTILTPRRHAVQQEMLIRMLRAALGEKVPNYMLPAHFMIIDEVPLNRNGKIDTAALPKPDIAKRMTYLAPEEVLKPTELRVAEIIAKVLDISAQGFTPGMIEVSVSVSSCSFASFLLIYHYLLLYTTDVDVFQDLGATSIVTIRLTEAINAAIHDVSLTVSILYHNSTIGKLAQYIDNASQQAAAENGGPAPSSSRNSVRLEREVDLGPQRCSFVWDLYWAFCCLMGLSLIYFMIIIPSWPALKFSTWILRETGSLLYALMSVPVAFLGYGFVLCAEMCLTKWILIGRYKPGPIPSRSFAFWRWWVVDRFIELGQRIVLRYFVGMLRVCACVCLVYFNIRFSVH